jgi:glycosyltransferase involved in cell wall biosynthesis
MKRVSHTLVLSTALSGGGAEAVARLMVERLDGASCLLFENDARIAVSGHDIWVIPRYSASSTGSKLLLNFWRVLYLQIIKLRLRPKVTISHLEGPNFANILTFWGGNRLIFVHNKVTLNYDSNHLIDRLKRFLIKVMYRRAHKVFGVSSDICKELIDIYRVDPRQIDFVPNPIDIARVKRRAQERYGDARDYLFSENYLISLASLTPQKNHKVLLQAFSEVIKLGKEYTALKLLLVGDGEEKIKLKQLCLQLGLSTYTEGAERLTTSAQVYFLGFLSNPYPLLLHARLLVMPSIWEGLPIALLEAMALGTPVIASNSSDEVRNIICQSSNLQGPSEFSDYERTPYGVLVHKTATRHDRSSISLWARLIEDTLADRRYLEDCSHNVAVGVKQHDIHNVSKMWREKFLLEA